MCVLFSFQLRACSHLFLCSLLHIAYRWLSLESTLSNSLALLDCFLFSFFSNYLVFFLFLIFFCHNHTLFLLLRSLLSLSVEYLLLQSLPWRSVSLSALSFFPLSSLSSLFLSFTEDFLSVSKHFSHCTLSLSCSSSNAHAHTDWHRLHPSSSTLVNVVFYRLVYLPLLFAFHFLILSFHSFIFNFKFLHFLYRRRLSASSITASCFFLPFTIVASHSGTHQTFRFLVIEVFLQMSLGFLPIKLRMFGIEWSALGILFELICSISSRSVLNWFLPISCLIWCRQSNSVDVCSSAFFIASLVLICK